MIQENRGKYVKRSTYQKLFEENKKLLKDIRILTEEGINPRAILLKIDWRKKFKEDKDLNDLIKMACDQYLDEHPETKAIIENFKK